ncbi:hypothetical protein OSB04_015492 [Centaurea solstitialis]|uniref:TIR domain-containing protein n=1 Tax=Centaurea solstitialis TaxID=347529 RepID=A0AA38W903_9ASTR|nr:hypothetical protein OSB04_015492 [Centaurea solstitialis]
MASTSSSAAITASPTVNYDIFLSFRGEDTRHTFTDHLNDKLNRQGISTFRDNEEISRGDELKPEIEKAIKASKGSIVVLSENYATSTWCLEELWKQQKNFKLEVKTSSKWTDDNVKRWREALTRIADLKGDQVSGSEVAFLEKIVDDIYHNKVARKLVDLPRHLTGMNARHEEISSWLEPSDIKVLVIFGMAGSGKTTLANYIVSLNSQYFECTSIVKVMGSISTQDNQHELLRKFVADLLGEGKGKWFDRYTIDRALKMKKALIVFDDIGEPNELEYFLGTGDINKQSKIIITTSRNNTHNWLQTRSWSCKEYNMQLLNNDEALELFSLHAFGFKIPKEGYEELAKEVLQYCQGIPVALEVLGSSLSEDVSIRHWKSTLESLEKDMHDRIHSVLIVSYNSLPNNLTRELFLHIACFFVGEDKDYVEQILDNDYSAPSGIKILTNRCLLFVSPNNKICFTITHFFSMLNFQPSDILTTDSLKKMDILKLLKLKDVHLTGNYKDFSEDLRWLCWHQFRFPTIPSSLFQGNLVAIDMSCSNLELFEPPIVLQSLKTLNLQGSKSLSAIRSIYRLPNIETLILRDCDKLVHVCESIGGLLNLVVLNMERCTSLHWCLNRPIRITNAILGRGSAQQTSFSLPHSLVWLFLSDCVLTNQGNDHPFLQFSGQPNLQYLDLSGACFQFLPSYNHLKTLRVLELSWCVLLKWLLDLPTSLAELYVYSCSSLERITFKSHRFTLKEFGYGGCNNLLEIEGFIKLVPIAKLVETDLRHMAWLKNYQYHEVSLVGDDELTLYRTKQIQMLYEFGITSTSLPDIKDPNMIYEYSSESPSVCFRVPSCPENKRLIGLNVSFKYTKSGDDDPAWFVKIRTNNGVDYMYNPHVFGRPRKGKVGIWLSFWPIGSKLTTGDEVNVSIIVMSEIMEAKECGASFVYVEDDETMEINMPWVETLGGDLSAFQLSTGANYLCRRDFFKVMEVGRLTRGWLSILVGHTIDDREVRGWRKTGRPNTSFNPSQVESSSPSLTELQDSPIDLTRTESSHPSRTDSSFNPSQTESSRPSLTKLPGSSSTESKKF